MSTGDRDQKTRGDESMPLRTVSAGEIAEAKAGAAALDLAEVERAHAAQARCTAPMNDDEGQEAHEHRGLLLAALRGARADADAQFTEKRERLAEYQRSLEIVQAKLREQEVRAAAAEQALSEERAARVAREAEWAESEARAVDEAARLRGALEEILELGQRPTGDGERRRQVDFMCRAAVRALRAGAITNIGPPGPAAQLLRQMAEGGQRQIDEETTRLLSLPVDACDGEPRPGEK